MGGLEHRLKRLEEKTGHRRVTAVCPECGAEFATDDDVWLDCFVLEWEQASGEGRDEHSTFAPHPATVELFNHEHDPMRTIEKQSGLPLFSREVSGMGMWDPIDRSQIPPQSHDDGG